MKSQRSLRYTVTLRQTFNGNNVLNNNVIVDYINKTVDFRAAKGDSTFKSIRMSFINSIMISFLTFTLIPIIPMVLFKIAGYELTILPVQYGLIYFCIVLGTGTLYFNKRFLKNSFPLFNYGMMAIGTAFHKKKRTLNPECIINNAYVLPEFSNVIIEYETTGDFSKYLERVEITQKYTNSPYKFQAAFIFSKPIKEGEMNICYY